MQTIDSKWQVLSEDNSGGQARILKVKDITTNSSNVYALKFLQRQNDIERRARMYHEVTNLEKLNDKHIVKIIDSNISEYKTDAKLYYVYSYIIGHTLEYLVNNQNFSLADILSFFNNLLETVDYCHSKGIVHRDIKPDNIVCENDVLSNYYLLDFGLSFNSQEPQTMLTAASQQLGNRFLALPELVGGNTQEKRMPQSDITQCCGILFYMLTKTVPNILVDGNGNPPHKRADMATLIAQRAISKICESNLLLIFDRAFAINVFNRYQNINDLKCDLSSLETPKFNSLGEIMTNIDNQSGLLPTASNIPYSELLIELNPITGICNPTGLKLPPVTNIPSLVPYGIALNSMEQKKTVQYYCAGDFATSAEKVWTRAIALLRKRILSLGENFVADMVDSDDPEYIQNLPAYRVICLANDLGFIDSAGMHKLLMANSTYNYYLNLTQDSIEEMPQDEANIIIKNSISYILYTEDETYGLKFNDFRDKLKSVKIADFSGGKEMFTNCPYFYLKTTVRSLLKLFSETTGIEFEMISENMNAIIPNIWNDLKTEERRSLADSYTDYMEANKTTHSQILSNILLKTQGFDYVKENIRSRTYIKVAKHLIDVHFDGDNFYNEPLAIMTLKRLGTKFPNPALKECITATLLVKVGNNWGISWDAQSIADELLSRLTPDEWSIYLNRYLPEESLLLDDLFGQYQNAVMYKRWKDIVKTYNLNSLSVLNTNIKRIL